MANESQPYLLQIPPEIRLAIYAYLLDDGGNQWLAIRNKACCRGDTQTCARRHSTKYHVSERTSMFHQRCYQTTYYLASDNVVMHTETLAVCRLLYSEASELLYAKHLFDFGQHIEAVVPFLSDRTPHTRSMVTAISVYKRGPFPCLGCTSDKYEWSYLCRYLRSMTTLKKMRIVVESGRPGIAWDGVQTLSESDIRLLSLIGHECLEWVKDLSEVKQLEELELVSEVKYLPVPKSPAMAVYAALSASIEEGLAAFLRTEMRL